MTDEKDNRQPAVTDGPEVSSVAVSIDVVQAEELFRGKREIWIELDGVRYRLRITRRNKLILQK